MYSFLKNSLLFLLFLLMFYILSIILIGSFFPKALQLNINYSLGFSGHLHSKIQDLKTIKQPDVLFVGSSHCYRGFDVRIFEKAGFNTFNLGSSSQSHLQTNILLKRYLDQVQPKTIIYEVYPEIFETDGIESTLDLISNDHNYAYLWGLVFHQNHIKIYNTFIYGFFRKTAGLDDDFIEPKTRGKDIYIKNGFVETTKMSFDPYFKKPLTAVHYRTDQLTAFEESIALIKERNIELMLVEAPVTRKYYAAQIGTEQHEKKMRQYGQYYNFNGEVDLIDTLHFYDYHHLNQAGVALFNQVLIEQLLSE